MADNKLLDEGKDFLSGVFTGSRPALTTKVEIDQKGTVELIEKILIGVVITTIVIVAFVRITKK